jgi:hypothetical protein
LRFALHPPQGETQQRSGHRLTYSSNHAEAFIIFSQDIPSQSLGFIDSAAATLDVSVAGHDLVIQQSRGLLTSDRKTGTTGAGMYVLVCS